MQEEVVMFVVFFSGSSSRRRVVVVELEPGMDIRAARPSTGGFDGYYTFTRLRRWDGDRQISEGTDENRSPDYSLVSPGVLLHRPDQVIQA